MYAVEELSNSTYHLVNEILVKCDFSELSTLVHRTHLFNSVNIAFLTFWCTSAVLLLVGAQKYLTNRNAIITYTPWLTLSVIIIILDIAQTICCIVDIVYTRNREGWMTYNGIRKIPGTEEWKYKIADTSAQAVTMMLTSSKGFVIIAFEIANAVIVMLDLQIKCGHWQM